MFNQNSSNNYSISYFSSFNAFNGEVLKALGDDENRWVLFTPKSKLFFKSTDEFIYGFKEIAAKFTREREDSNEYTSYLQFAELLERLDSLSWDSKNRKYYVRWGNLYAFSIEVRAIIDNKHFYTVFDKKDNRWYAFESMNEVKFMFTKLAGYSKKTGIYASSCETIAKMFTKLDQLAH